MMMMMYYLVGSKLFSLLLLLFGDLFLHDVQSASLLEPFNLTLVEGMFEGDIKRLASLGTLHSASEVLAGSKLLQS